MVRIHNKLEWANHKKETFRPSNERIKLEIFSYDHQYTKTFLPATTNIRGSNRVKVNHRSLKCYESKDKTTSFTLEFLFNIKSRGEYRIDILYENKNGKDLHDLVWNQKGPVAQSKKSVEDTIKNAMSLYCNNHPGEMVNDISTYISYVQRYNKIVNIYRIIIINIVLIISIINNFG